MGPVLLLAGFGSYLIPQTPMDKHLSLMLPAARVEIIVKELSSASGVPMAATGVLSKDIVVLKVHDKPLSEIMKRIADVIDGTWKDDNGTYRLTRTARQDTEQEARERKYRASAILNEINRSKAIQQETLTADEAKKLSGQFQKLKQANPEYAFDPNGRLDSPLNMTPVRRALLRTLSALDLDDVAMLEPGDRIAYSNKPNRIQRPLPGPIESILSKFVAEQTVWIDAIAGLPEDENPHFGGDPLNERAAIEHSPDRLLLIASRSNSSALVYFTLFVIADGGAIASTSLSIQNDAIRQIYSQFMKPSTTPGAKVVLTPNSLTMLDATKGFGRPSTGPLPGPSPAAVALLTEPEKVDPLSIVATDGLVSVADDKHENLIASLPDELIAFNIVQTTKGQSVSDFLNMASGLGELEATETGGWLSFKPMRPYSIRRLRLDRGSFGAYMRGIVAESRASLDAQSVFELTSQPSDYDMLGAPLAMLLDLNSTQNIDQDTITLKLWGALTKEQKKDLIGGEKIPFKALTPAQLELVEREAYHRAMKNQGQAMQVKTPQDYQRMMEPTECLPNGLPPDGYLSVKVTNSKAILASSTQKNVRMSYARLFDASQMGATLAAYEGMDANSNPMFDRFQIVDRATYAFSYFYTPTIADHVTLHDVIVPSDGKAVAFGDLPKDLQASIQAAKDSAKANLANQPGVQRVPPPGPAP